MIICEEKPCRRLSIPNIMLLSIYHQRQYKANPSCVFCCFECFLLFFFKVYSDLSTHVSFFVDWFTVLVLNFKFSYYCSDCLANRSLKLPFYYEKGSNYTFLW